MESPSATDEMGETIEAEPIGAYLAKHRQMRGISIDELAETTRIPLRSIKRLESGAFDHDIDGFVRGFVRTVSDALGLDTDDTMRRLHEPGAENSVVSRSRLLAPSVLGIAAAAMVGLAVMFAGVQVVRALWMPSESQRDGLVRRDPVRALAEAQGFDASLDGARLPAGSSQETSAPPVPPDVSAPPQASPSP